MYRKWIICNLCGKTYPRKTRHICTSKFVSNPGCSRTKIIGSENRGAKDNRLSTLSAQEADNKSESSRSVSLIDNPDMEARLSHVASKTEESRDKGCPKDNVRFPDISTQEAVSEDESSRSDVLRDDPFMVAEDSQVLSDTEKSPNEVDGKNLYQTDSEIEYSSGLDLSVDFIARQSSNVDASSCETTDFYDSCGNIASLGLESSAEAGQSTKGKTEGISSADNVSGLSGHCDKSRPESSGAEGKQSKKRKTVVASSVDRVSSSSGSRSSAATEESPEEPNSSVYSAPGPSTSHQNVSSSETTSSSHSESGEKNFCCWRCGKVFNTRLRLQMHVHKHIKGIYRCSECQKAFNKRSHYKKHLKKHPRGIKFQCPLCSEIFREASKLRVHLKIHTIRHYRRSEYEEKQKRVRRKENSGNERPKCAVCGKKCRSKLGIKRHVAMVHGSQFHKCPKCGKVFKTNSVLNRHLNSHFKKKKHECPTCRKKFPHQYALKRHRKIHNSDVLYECPLCHKMFFHTEALRVHYLHHVPDQCPKCGKVFNRKRLLDTHQCE